MWSNSSSRSESQPAHRLADESLLLLRHPESGVRGSLCVLLLTPAPLDPLDMRHDVGRRKVRMSSQELSPVQPGVDDRRVSVPLVGVRPGDLLSAHAEERPRAFALVATDDCGHVGPGTRLREIHKVLGIRRVEVTEVVVFEPGRRFDIRVVEGPPVVRSRNYLLRKLENYELSSRRRAPRACRAR
jgi:hypothetical protein